MGVTTHEAPRSGRTPLELTRSTVAPASAQVSQLTRLTQVTQVSQRPAAAPGLVVIVAACPAEQQRLLACLPADVPVLVTTSAEQAEQLLHTLPPSAVPTQVTLSFPVPSSVPAGPAGPTVRAAERTVSWAGGHSVRLTPLEFALLQTLISDQGRVWSFAELSTKVWATGFVGDGAQVRAVVKRLRRKLAEAQAPVMVETVRGSGFRLAARPTPCGT